MNAHSGSKLIRCSEKPSHVTGKKPAYMTGDYSLRGNTRSHSEHDRETRRRRWYYALRYGRVCGRQSCKPVFLFLLGWLICLKFFRSLLSRSNRYAQSLAKKFLRAQLSLAKNISVIATPDSIRGKQSRTVIPAKAGIHAPRCTFTKNLFSVIPLLLLAPTGGEDGLPWAC